MPISTSNQNLNKLKREQGHEFFTLPPTAPRRQDLADGIKQRFVFLKTLLSAEQNVPTANQIQDPPDHHHLKQIGLRVRELEAAFRNWDEFRHSTVHLIDTASTCSCAESCFDDEDDVDGLTSGPVIREEPQSFIEAEKEEEEEAAAMEEPEVFLDAAMSKEEKAAGAARAARGGKKREEGRFWAWRNFGVMASSMVVGAVLMGVVMVGFCECFHNHTLYQSFPHPT